MIITGILTSPRRLLKYLNINSAKFDINCNLVLLYYKKKHGKQYAFLTDQYCKRCIHYYNRFESTTDDKDTRVYINNFAYHIIDDHNYI